MLPLTALRLFSIYLYAFYIFPHGLAPQRIQHALHIYICIINNNFVESILTKCVSNDDDGLEEAKAKHVSVRSYTIYTTIFYLFIC